MIVYLFIFTVTAGASSTSGPSYQKAHWKSQWQNAGTFSMQGCHKAAANLGLAKTEYRCIDNRGDVQ